MKGKGPWRPVWVSRSMSFGGVQGTEVKRELLQGMDLYEIYNGFVPSRVMRIPHRRLTPPVVVELGELVGVIYRSDKGQRSWPHTYIHVMEDPPRLVSNVDGTQLYIVGGSYRVTGRGIEG